MQIYLMVLLLFTSVSKAINSDLILEGSDRQAFIIGKEENTTFLHLSFDKLQGENSVTDDRNLIEFVMQGKASLSKTRAKCGRSIRFSRGHMDGKWNSSVVPQPAFPIGVLTVATWIVLEDPAKYLVIFKCERPENGDFVSLFYNASHINWEIKFKRSMHVSRAVADLDVEQLKHRQWVHIAATYDSAFGLMNIFKNGRLIHSSYVNGEQLSAALWRKGLYSLWVRQGAEELSGKLDEFYVINAALASTEVKDLMGICNVGIDFGIPIFNDTVQTSAVESETMNFTPLTNKAIKPGRKTLDCLGKNPIVDLDATNDNLGFTYIQSLILSLDDCLEKCCDLERCKGYTHIDNRCELFSRVQTTNKTKATLTVCTDKTRPQKAIRGSTEGQWNIIFLSIAPDLSACTDTVCNDGDYELVRFDTVSKNCFGMYCKGSEECKIYEDPLKSSYFLPLTEAHGVSKAPDPDRIVSKNKDNDNVDDPLALLDKLDILYSSNNCELDFEVKNAVPSENTILTSVIVRTRAESSSSCLQICCQTEGCNLAFIVEFDCLSLKCPKQNECLVHKNTDFDTPTSALFVRRGVGNLVDPSETKNNDHAKNKGNCKKTIYSHAKIDVDRINGEIVDVFPNTPSLRACNSDCCKDISCNLVYFNNHNCYFLVYRGFFGNLINYLTKTKEESFVTSYPNKHLSKDPKASTSLELVLRKMVGEHQSNPSPWPVSSDPDVLDSEETKSKPIKQRLDRLKTNCHNNINLCAQICIPVFESYMCTCRQGFELEDDGTSCKEAKVRDRISGRADLASDIGIRSRVSTYYRLPKIVKLPTLLEYIEGDSAALACSAVGNPQPNVSWSRRSDTGGLEPLPADFHSDIGGNLAIERLKHSDEGDYLCEAENSLGNDSKVVTIRIKAPPKCFYQRGLCDAVCEEEGLSCSCPPGYRLTEISRQCKDIDECNGSSCPQICQNTPGSYTCSCEPEFRAGTDGLSCEPVQACGRNDLKCLPAYRITDGKKTCDCVEGFAYFQDVNTCFRESPPVFSLATMSPLFIALGAIGLTLVASGVITVGIVFIVGSRQDKD